MGNGLHIIHSLTDERQDAWVVASLAPRVTTACPRLRPQCSLPGSSLWLVCCLCSRTEQMSVCFSLFNDDGRFPVIKIQFHIFWNAIAEKSCVAQFWGPAFFAGIFALQRHMDWRHRGQEWSWPCSGGAGDWGVSQAWSLPKYICSSAFLFPPAISNTRTSVELVN